MNKFSIGQMVRVIDPKSNYYNKIGMIEVFYPAGMFTSENVYKIKYSDNLNSGQFLESELKEELWIIK